MATLGQRHQDGQVRGCGKTGTSQAGHGGTSWPNNPLERTAHSVGSLVYSWRFSCGPQFTGSIRQHKRHRDGLGEMA
jgi:hypothetical protein